jgi:hypothetical protein
MTKNCDVRMGCDNCGHVAMYQVPVRHIIQDYDPDVDAEHSYYFRPNKREEITYLLCVNCQLAYLKVLWKDESIVEVSAGKTA